MEEAWPTPPSKSHPCRRYGFVAGTILNFNPRRGKYRKPSAPSETRTIRIIVPRTFSNKSIKYRSQSTIPMIPIGFILLHSEF